MIHHMKIVGVQLWVMLKAKITQVKQITMYHNYLRSVHKIIYELNSMHKFDRIDFKDVPDVEVPSLLLQYRDSNQKRVGIIYPIYVQKITKTRTEEELNKLRKDSDIRRLASLGCDFSTYSYYELLQSYEYILADILKTIKEFEQTK